MDYMGLTKWIIWG